MFPRVSLARTLAVAICAAWGLAPAPPASSEGTPESLSPISIPLASGSGFAVGGTGLFEYGPPYTNVDGDIFVAVPGDATVQQVILYWLGEYWIGTAPDTEALVNGVPVTGTSIGGPTEFSYNLYYETYRVDITDLGVVAPGGNVVNIAGLDYSYRTGGAGIIVVYDNGEVTDLQLVDGQDLAYWNFASPLDATVPVIFTFAPAPYDRPAKVPVLVGDVGENRPNVVRIWVDGNELVYDTPFASLDGPEWDSQTFNLTIPAGASSITMQLFSEDLKNSGLNPASMTWVAGGLAIMPPEDEEVPCQECDGKVTTLTLQYEGSVSNAQVKVLQKKDNVVVFDGVVQPGEEFSFTGEDKQGTLGTEILVYVGGVLHTKIHTSCSQPIGPGLVFGDFRITAGESRNGGPLCPLDGGGGGGCAPCDGKVNALTLQYQGSQTDAFVEVDMKKDGNVFSGTVQPGETFSFVGADKHNTLGTEITVRVNGVENTNIHTSCSQPIGPGMVKGDFLIVAGSSRNGGELCPLDNGGSGGALCEDSKPKVLQMVYTGESCDASSHAQDSGKVACSGDPAGEPQVYIVASDKENWQDNKARIYFQGDVFLNGAFAIDATNAGTTRLRSNTYVFIYDFSNNLLQTIQFHTSCSQPLNIGDQYGSVQLTGFVSEKGSSPISMPRLAEPRDANANKMVGCAGSGSRSSLLGLGDGAVLVAAAGVLLALMRRNGILKA